MSKDVSIADILLANKKNLPVFDVSNFTAKNISERDLQIIGSLYGTNVENIYNLSAGQKWMFKKEKTKTSAFFLQIMIKAKMELNPVEFRIKVDEMTKNRDSLRSVYIYKETSVPYRVVLKNRQSDIRFKDLSDVSLDELDEKLNKLMMRDREEGFDLENDPLLRINVYKTCEENYYAIIISQPHINTDGVSLGILMQELFLGFDLSGFGHGVKSTFKEYAEWLDSIDYDKEKEYWKGILEDAPALKEVPGHISNNYEYELGSYMVTLDDAIFKKLQEKQKEFGATIFNIIQTTWGIMYSKIHNSNDVIYGSITAGRDANVSGSNSIMGGFIGVIPVRLKYDNDMTVKEVIKNVQKQFGYSMTRAHCSLDEINKNIGREEPLFNLLLNCHNFQNSASCFKNVPKLPGMELVGAEAYDNLAEDLCIYIVPQTDKITLNFSYNQKAFLEESIKLLAKNFEDTLRQIVFSEGELKIGDIKGYDISQFNSLENDRKKRIEELKAFYRCYEPFKSLEEEDFEYLAENTRIDTYNEDTVIIKARVVFRRFCFVYDGVVARYMFKNDGWLSKNPVQIYTKGGDIAYAPLIPNNSQNIFQIESLKDGTKIASVPIEVIWNLMKKNYTVSIGFIKLLFEDIYRLEAID